MRTRSTDFRSTVEYLPEGAVLALEDVTWDEYETLQDELVDRPGVRVTYDRGALTAFRSWLQSQPRT